MKRSAHFRTILRRSPTRRPTSACDTPSASNRIMRARITSRYGYVSACAISSRTIRCSRSRTTFNRAFLTFGCLDALAFIPLADHDPLTTKVRIEPTDRNRSTKLMRPPDH